jgi:hypothetical protein
MRFASSSPGTVLSLASRSTAPSCFDTGFTSNNADTRRPRSIFGWPPSGASRTRRPTPGLLSPELAAGIRRVKGVRRIGVRLGNWLTPEQGRRLLESATPLTARELRDHAMVAMLIGCGLRRAELLALSVQSIQQREEHWVIADLVGKAGHVRTVPIPTWVKAAVDAWTEAAAITNGSVFRAINKAGRVWGRGMSPKVLWDVVRAAAARAGIDKLAPHDLRRTCARLCHLAGGELDQIQFLLGHVSIQTTERYLGCKQKLRVAVNDRLGIEPMPLDQTNRRGGCFNPPWATRFDSQSIVHGNSELLFAPEVTLGRLDGDVAEQKLDLIQFAAGEVAEACAGAPEIMRCEPVDAGAPSRCPYHVPEHFRRHAIAPIPARPC